MKIELSNNKVFYKNGTSSEEIHPFWLRERANGEKHLDKGTQQRLFDPTSLDVEVQIKEAQIKDQILEINFNDGVNSKLDINLIAQEFSKKDIAVHSIEKIKWDSSLKSIKNFEFKDDLFESEEMYNILVSFYKYGFVALAPHTDNPYRNPVPCIQILHCITNEVKGGFSTLVEGFTVTEALKKDNPEFYDILTKVKVRFKFIDKDVVLEDWSELIKLDEDNQFKQVRFSPRLDYVPILEKKDLDLYYKARKKISDLYNSEKYRIEFKLQPGDLLMMDNHRLLHGRTEFDVNEGNRFLQGCYIEFDSTEGKLRHLKRKYNL